MANRWIFMFIFVMALALSWSSNTVTAPLIVLLGLGIIYALLRITNALESIADKLPKNQPTGVRDEPPDGQPIDAKI